MHLPDKPMVAVCDGRDEEWLPTPPAMGQVCVLGCQKCFQGRLAAVLHVRNKCPSVLPGDCTVVADCCGACCCAETVHDDEDGAAGAATQKASSIDDEEGGSFGMQAAAVAAVAGAVAVLAFVGLRLAGH